MKRYLYFLLIISTVFCSCTNSKEYQDIKRDFQSVRYKEADKSIIDSIVNEIPDNSLISENINKLHKHFDKSLLLPVEDDIFCKNSKETALKIGSYIANLGYIRHFEEVNLCFKYLEVVKTLSNKLAIASNLFDEFVPKFEEKIDNKVALFEFIDSLMNIGKYYFSDSEQYGLGALLLSGFWLECSYIGFSKNSINNKCEEIISSHFEILKHINNLLKEFEDNEIISRLKITLLDLYNNKENLEKTFADITTYREELIFYQ